MGESENQVEPANARARARRSCQPGPGPAEESWCSWKAVTVREAEGTEPEAGRTGGRADGRTGWDRWRLSGWGASGCLSKAQRSLDTVLAVPGEGVGEGTVTERRLGLGRRPEPQRSLRPPLTPSLPGGRAVRSRAASRSAESRSPASHHSLPRDSIRRVPGAPGVMTETGPALSTAVGPPLQPGEMMIQDQACPPTPGEAPGGSDTAPRNGGAVISQVSFLPTGQRGKRQSVVVGKWQKSFFLLT
ncbi:uncharacterized protein LOC109491635 [Felis catus]|uniref:uncharacterized protein LOC109491635 n=1 Tax=Felis catus TaxID=9685 RepID=UPI001D198B64|nr:uncharacterized protein LOC109491635 [Felis catus]